MLITYLQKAIAVLQIHDAAMPTLNYGFVEKLATAVQEINKNKQLKAVVITGGEKYFSSGAEATLLDTIRQRGKALYTFTSYVADIPRLITAINVPTIAVMAGHAIGGGLAMGLWCDSVIMAKESLYGANFIKLGFTPGMGSTAILPYVFGNFLGYEMLFTGKLFKGAEIKFANRSLANYILPSKAVYERACELAVEIANISENSVRLLKQSMMTHKKELLEPTLVNELNMHNSLKSVTAIA
jgi:polyketide biosynthesis enoyl-CoA hydratase PksI